MRKPLTNFLTRTTVRAAVLFVAAAALACALPDVAQAASAIKVTYQEHIRPIFQEHCFACHSQDGKKSDLALDTYADALAGGVGGEPFAAGDLSGSRLWLMITHEESPAMPPGQDKLPQAKLDLVAAWIEGGLLADAGSKSKVIASPLATSTKPQAGNRPKGEPAMPQGLLRQPLIVPAQATSVAAAATSPWAPVAAIGGPRQVSLYHTQTHALLGVLPFPEGTPEVIRFSRDGSLLVVGGGESAKLGRVGIYDVKSGIRIATLGDEIDTVLAADISPDHQLVALGGPKKRVRVYRVADGSLAYEIKKHTEWITALEFSPDGKQLASADRNGSVLLWKAHQGHELAQLNGHKQAVTALTWRADSAMLATASEDDTLRTWQPSGKQLKTWNPHGKGDQQGVLSVAFASDGRVATTGRDRRVRLWQADGKKLKDCEALEEMGLVVCFTHDGKQVLAGDWNGNAPLLSVETGKRLANLPPNPPRLEVLVAQSNAAVELAKAELAEMQQQLQTEQAQLAAAEKQRSDHRQRRKAAASKVAKLNKQRTAKSKEVAAAATDWQAAEELLAKAVDEKLAAENLLAGLQTSPNDSANEKPDNERSGDEAAQAAAEKIKQAEVAVAKATASVTEAERKIASSNQQRTATDEAFKKVTAELTVATKAHEQLLAANSKLPRIGPLGKAVEKAVQQRDQAANKLAASQRQQQVSAAALKRFQEAATRYTQAAERVKKELEKRSKSHRAAQQTAEEMAALLSQIDEKTQELAKQLKELQQQRNELKKQRQAAQSQQATHAKQVQSAAEQLMTAEQQLARLAAQQQAYEIAEKLREADKARRE